MKLEQLNEARLIDQSEATWNKYNRRTRQINLKIQHPQGNEQEYLEPIIKDIIDNARIAAEQLGVSVPKEIRYMGIDNWVYITAKTNALREIIEKIANKTRYVSVHSDYEYLKDKGRLKPKQPHRR